MKPGFLSEIGARRDRLARALAARDPAARKAGGAVYTPPCVVAYLVERTVGTLLEGKSPREAAQLRILDPACGAGAFLLGAYRLLLDWHLRYYTAHEPRQWATRRNPPICEAADRPNRQSAIGNRQSTWRLTPAERRRILLNSLFGVDVDPAAVELTRLSLLLAALREEEDTGPGACRRIHAGCVAGVSGPDARRVASSSLLACGQTVPLAGERRGVAVPRGFSDRLLERNIRCGDALVGPDLAQGRQGLHFEGESRPPVRPFDWRAAFPKVFAGEAPGFDVVLGNPPYLSFSGREAARLAPAVRAYFASHYETAGWPTAHGLFIERAVTLLSRRFVAFIVPDQVGHLAGYRGVRALVARHSRLAEVRYWGEDVFPGVVTPALSFIADKEHKGAAAVYDREQANAASSRRAPKPHASDAGGGPNRASASGVRRLEAASSPGAPWIAPSHLGLIEKLRERSFSLGELVADIGVHTGNCARKLILPLDEAPPGAVPILEGKRVGRYSCLPPAKALRLDYAAQPGEYFTLRPPETYAAASFVIRQTAPHPIVGPRRGALHFRNSLLALYPPEEGLDARYLAALLNSRLLRFAYRELVPESRQRAFPQVKVGSLRKLPLRTIDLADPSDAARHGRIVALADRLLSLHAAPPVAERERDRERRRSETEAAEQELDGLIYQLYGLTEQEIATVEAG